MSPKTRKSAALACAMTCIADAASAANASGAMPWSPWFTQLRASLSGEVALTICLISVVCGLSAWVWGGDLSGMMGFLVRVVVGISIIMGAVAFLAAISAGGAVFS